MQDTHVNISSESTRKVTLSLLEMALHEGCKFFFHIFSELSAVDRHVTDAMHVVSESTLYLLKYNKHVERVDLNLTVSMRSVDLINTYFPI